MSDLIVNAMNYSKERAPRWTEVKFELNVNAENPDNGYFLQIAYEPVEEGWHAIIETDQHVRGEMVGEVVSEKWSLGQMFFDEDYEAPEKIEA